MCWNVVLLALTFAPPTAMPRGRPVAHLSWAPGSVTEQANAPSVVVFGRGHALRFVRSRQTRLRVGPGEANRLRLEGALTVAAVVELGAAPPTKVALVSKWATRRGGRSYELGVNDRGRLFFTVSASGSWPERARELVSTRPLKVGEPYLVAAAFEPGKRMALFVNGVPSGETTEHVPASLYDSETPVLLGNRSASTQACAFEGVIGDVWFHSAALDASAVAAWAKQLGLDQPPEPEPPTLKPPSKRLCGGACRPSRWAVLAATA